MWCCCCCCIERIILYTLFLYYILFFNVHSMPQKDHIRLHTRVYIYCTKIIMSIESARMSMLPYAYTHVYSIRLYCNFRLAFFLFCILNIISHYFCNIIIIIIIHTSVYNTLHRYNSLTHNKIKIL